MTETQIFSLLSEIIGFEYFNADELRFLRNITQRVIHEIHYEIEDRMSQLLPADDYANPAEAVLEQSEMILMLRTQIQNLLLIQSEIDHRIPGLNPTTLD